MYLIWETSVFAAVSHLFCLLWNYYTVLVVRLPIRALMHAPTIVPIAWCVSDESAIQTYLIRHEYSKSVSRDSAFSRISVRQKETSESCLLLLVVMRIGTEMGFMGSPYRVSILSKIGEGNITRRSCR